MELYIGIAIVLILVVIGIFSWYAANNMVNDLKYISDHLTDDNVHILDKYI